MLLVNCIWLHITSSEWVKNTSYAVEIIFYSFHYKWLSDCPVLGKRLVYLGNTKIVWSKVLCYRPWLCAVLCFQSQWENNLGFNSTGLDFLPPFALNSRTSIWTSLFSSTLNISVCFAIFFSYAKVCRFRSALPWSEWWSKHCWQHPFMKMWLWKFSRPFKPLTSGHDFSPFTEWPASHKCWLCGWCR